MTNKLPINISKEQLAMLLPFAPFAVLVLIIIIFFSFIFLPLNRKLSDLKTQIRSKESVLVRFERSGVDFNKLTTDIKELEVKITEYEKKLLEGKQADILIDTLKDITAESYIKFSSIEPQTPKKFSLTKQKDIYFELPIKVKLKSGYYELIDFLAKIEKAGRLMKITDLEIKGSSGNIWEHSVLLLISTFSRIADEEPGSG